MTPTRRQLGDALVDRLTSGGNIALHGGPGVGKSWVASYVCDRISETVGEAVVRVRLNGHRDGLSAMRSLAKSLELEVRKRDEIYDLAAYVARYNSSSVVYLLVENLDAVEAYPDGADFLRLLREILDRTGPCDFRGLVVGRKSIRTIEEGVRGISTLEGMFHATYLLAMSCDDIRQSWNLQNASAEEIADLCHWSGQIPHLVVAYVSWRDSRESPAARDVHRHEWVLNEIAHLEKCGVAHAAAQILLGPEIHVSPLVRAQLSAMGITGRRSDEDAPPMLSEFHAFITALSSRYSDNLEPWGELGRLEIATRRLVRILMNHSSIVSEAPRLNGVGDSVVRSTSAHTVRFSPAGPGDYWRIALDLWPLTPAVFRELGKPYWQKRLGVSGVCGAAAGRRLEFSTQDVLSWTDDIETMTELLSGAGSEVGSAVNPPTLGASGTLSVSVGDGSIVNLASPSHASQSASTPLANDPHRGQPGSPGFAGRMTAILGALASIAAIVTLVYYVVDR